MLQSQKWFVPTIYNRTSTVHLLFPLLHEDRKGALVIVTDVGVYKSPALHAARLHIEKISHTRLADGI